MTHKFRCIPEKTMLEKRTDNCTAVSSQEIAKHVPVFTVEICWIWTWITSKVCNHVQIWMSFSWYSLGEYLNSLPVSSSVANATCIYHVRIFMLRMETGYLRCIHENDYSIERKLWNSTAVGLICNKGPIWWLDWFSLKVYHDSSGVVTEDSETLQRWGLSATRAQFGGWIGFLYKCIMFHQQL